MAQSETTVTWRGLTMIGSFGSRHLIKSLDGWDELPPDRFDGDARPQGHGRFDAPVWADARTVTVAGSCWSLTERDALLAELNGAMTWPSGRGTTEPLVITHAGLTLTAFARLRRFRPEIGPEWGAGRFTWVAQWVCPDPLRYGAVVAPAAVGFPAPGGGLRTPLFTNGATGVGRLDFGLPGTTGRVTVANPGTADASPQFTAAGPVASEGFDIVCVETGERLTFATAVQAGSTLVLDSGTGAVLLNGGADQSGYLTSAQWPTVPARSSRTFAFLPRGSATQASFTVTLRPAWW